MRLLHVIARLFQVRDLPPIEAQYFLAIFQGGQTCLKKFTPNRPISNWS